MSNLEDILLKYKEEPKELSVEERLAQIDEKRKAEEEGDQLLEKYAGDEKAASVKDEEFEKLRASLSGDDLEEKEEPSFMESFVQGAKEELIPFALSDEDIEAKKRQDTSVKNLAGEVTGGLVTGVAATATVAKLGAVAGAALSGPAAPLGSVIGAGVAVVGYALYSGFGQEKLNSDIAGQDFSTSRALARTALQINPAARIGGKAAGILAKYSPKAVLAAKEAQEKTATAVARGVAQVAGETAVATSTYGAETGAVTAAASALLSPLIFAKIKGAPTPHEVNSFHEAMSGEVGLGLIEAAAPKIEKAMNKKVHKKSLTNPKFIDYVLSKPGNLKGNIELSDMTEAQKYTAFQKLRSFKGEEGSTKGGITDDLLREMYKGYRARNILIGEAKKLNIQQQKRIAAEMGTENAAKVVELMDAFGGTFKWMADGQYIGRAIDKKLGYNFTSQLNGISETNNKFEASKIGLYAKILEAQKAEKALLKEMPELGKNKNEMSQSLARLRIYISENDENYLTPALEKFVDKETRTITDPRVQNVMLKWNDFFELARETINSTGYFTPKVDYYTTRKALKDTDLAISIQRSMQDIKRYAISARVDDIFSLTSKDLASIGVTGKEAADIMNDIKSLSYMATTRLKDVEELTEKNVAELVGSLISEGKSRLGLGYELSAVMSRSGQNIAPRFRDLNLTSVALRYIESNVRTAFFSKDYVKLSDSLDIVRAVGLRNAADWMQDHLDDVVGGTASGKTKVSNMLLSGAEALKFRYTVALQNTWFKDTVVQRAAEGLPEFLGKWQSMIYPSYLGLNVRAHLRDYGQVILKAAPELGGWYGYKTAFLSYKDAINASRDPSTGRFSFNQLKETLQERGVLGTSNITAEAIRNYGGKSVPGAGLYRQANESMMAIYSLGDMTNRIVTYHMGKRLASDLARGDEAAIKALQRLGPAAKSNLKAAGLREAIDSGDMIKAGDILGKWLVGKTQFHYGLEQKAKYARFMGPMFSMFTKWPTSIGSEIIEMWNENPGAYRKLQKFNQLYGAPLAALAGIDYTVDHVFGGSEEGAYNYAIGSTTEMTPLASVGFTLFQNPTLEMADYFLQSAKKAIEDPSAESFSSAGKSIVKRVSKQSFGSVSAIINEIERYEKRYQGEDETMIDEALNAMFGE